MLFVSDIFTLLVSSSRELRLVFRDQFFCYLIASIVVTLIVGADIALWRKA